MKGRRALRGIALAVGAYVGVTSWLAVALACYLLELPFGPAAHVVAVAIGATATYATWPRMGDDV